MFNNNREYLTTTKIQPSEINISEFQIHMCKYNQLLKRSQLTKPISQRYVLYNTTGVGFLLTVRLNYNSYVLTVEVLCLPQVEEQEYRHFSYEPTHYHMKSVNIREL